MSDDDVFAFSRERDMDDVLKMLQWWRSRGGTDGQPTTGATPPTPYREPLVVALLDDLVSASSVQATVLEPRANLNETQVITALGAPGGGFMRWGFKASAFSETVWTPNIYPMVDDSYVIEGYLQALKGLSVDDVRVTLGRIKTNTSDGIVAHDMWRWQVTFQGQYAGQEMQPIQIDSHMSGSYVLAESKTDWIDTGRVVTVSEVLGVPFPTPLKAGARMWVHWKARLGWCVIAGEARDFGAYGLF